MTTISPNSAAASSRRVVHLALGSNLPSPAGDRLATLGEAVRRLLADGRSTLVAISHAYETDPDPPGQPAYLNAVVAIATEHPLPELLGVAHDIERSLGRVRQPTARWGPRTIDVDILADGESVWSSEGLTVPHPRLAERAFVLVPLAEIAGPLRLPGFDRTIADLAAESLARPGVAATVRLHAPVPRLNLAATPRDPIRK